MTRWLMQVDERALRDDLAVVLFVCLIFATFMAITTLVRGSKK